MSSIASDNIKLSIGQWNSDDISAENLTFDIKLTESGLELIASADSLDLATPIGTVNDVKLHCQSLLVRSEQFSCVGGDLAFQQQELGQQKLTFEITARPDQKQYRIKISGLSLASATMMIDAELNDEAWQANMTTPTASLAPLIKFISPYLEAEQLSLLSKWTVEGDIALTSKIEGISEDISSLDLELSATSINLSDIDTQYVTENVATSLTLKLVKQAQSWLWQATIDINDGQGYGEPVFIDFHDTPMMTHAQGLWYPTGNHIEVFNAEFEHQNVAIADIKFIGSFGSVEQLEFDLKPTDIVSVYEIWLQPFMVGTAADSIELTGNVSLYYQQQADSYQLSLGLEHVFIDDNTDRFGLDNVSGNVAWTNSVKSVSSDLQWQGGYVYAIPLGRSQLKAQTKLSTVTLTEPWHLSVLDGELQVKEFSLHRPGEEQTKWTFDGLLTPISMESLSIALGWPLLHGKLSGVIPKVSYAGHYIQVDGELSVNLFEGTTVIRDLQVDKPFGALPQLYANIDMKALNLEALTQTFDFGKITGKLEGNINNLRLSNWQPVQFDASFSTPENDKSRRKISQKAVDNLSQIGGGARGLLQRSFLRFFEDFSYQKLGLSCSLRNEVCEMSGVADAEQGYYIVKGGGLPPRINVVGYTQRVNWPDLIERLKAVSESSGPVVR